VFEMAAPIQSPAKCEVRSVIRFLNAKCERSAEIHKKMFAVYGNGIAMRLVRLIKMCLSETYSRDRVGNNLSEIFPIKNGLIQGDTLSPLLFKFALEYAFRRV
jgi:hypothetical protein